MKTRMLIPVLGLTLQLLPASVLALPADAFFQKGHGNGYPADFSDAERDAIEQADARCVPSASVRVSRWNHGKVGGYGGSYASARFACGNPTLDLVMELSRHAGELYGAACEPAKVEDSIHEFVCRGNYKTFTLRIDTDHRNAAISGILVDLPLDFEPGIPGAAYELLTFRIAQAALKYFQATDASTRWDTAISRGSIVFADPEALLASFTDSDQSSLAFVEVSPLRGIRIFVGRAG